MLRTCLSTTATLGIFNAFCRAKGKGYGGKDRALVDHIGSRFGMIVRDSFLLGATIDSLFRIRYGI